MSVTIVETPTYAPSGRKPRLSDEDAKDLAEAVKAGHWASDGQPAPSKSAAYQRAQSARKILGERFKLTDVKTHVAPANPEKTDDKDPHNWSVGPRPEGEKPRKTKTNGAAK